MDIEECLEYFIKCSWYREFSFCNSDFENIIFSYLFSFPEGIQRFGALKNLFPLYFQSLTFEDYQAMGGLSFD